MSVTTQRSKMYPFESFLLYHQSQLKTSEVPVHMWKTLYEKLQNSVFDAGDSFTVIKIEYSSEDEEPKDENDVIVELEETASGKKDESSTMQLPSYGWKVIVSKKDGVKSTDPSEVYLIDHAWTYQTNDARKNLQENHSLLKRMAELMDVDQEKYSEEELINCVLTEMWRYNQTYSISGLVVNGDDSLPVWYIMDEFGSRVQHSDSASFRIVPFYYMPESITYSIMFPIKNLKYEEEVTRNYIDGPTFDKLTYQAMKIPWEYCDMTNVDCCPDEQDAEYFNSGRIQETLPDLTVDFPPVNTDETLKVFSCYKVIILNLTDPRFEMTASEDEADILWYDYHFKAFRELSQNCPYKFVNQFPFEHILTVKDLFAAVCRRSVNNILNRKTLEFEPHWLPATFNLKTELPKFVSYYQQRERNGLDNYWICKPWNLARGMDMHITNDLNYILRLPFTGPKIACKYLTDPVLFPREDVGLVKFDIRYILLFRNVKPLQLYAYKHFWLRFANKPYSLDSFDDYEKHFTVMNYRPTNLQQMFCDKFIEKFEAYYRNIKWFEVEAQIFEALRKVFEAAISKDPPVGICHSPQSRAMYAVDLMLQWKRDSERSSMHPVLLEINWAPDCNRACQYYPHFFNDVFSVLFLDEISNKNVVLL